MGKIIVEGLKEIIKDVNDWGNSTETSTSSFLNLLEKSSHTLLRLNTPVDTGELRDSWITLQKSTKLLEIGVREDQEAKLSYVVGGTKNIPPNPFLDIVENAMNQIISQALGKELVQRHRYWSPVLGKMNITSTVGLTGSRFGAGRVFGRSSTYRPRTGRKSNRVTIRRPRRRGQSILSKSWKMKFG